MMGKTVKQMDKSYKLVHNFFHQQHAKPMKTDLIGKKLSPHQLKIGWLIQYIQVPRFCQVQFPYVRGASRRPEWICEC